MKDVATPASQSEVRGTIKEALTKAALVNYERLSEEARIEGTHRFSSRSRGGFSYSNNINLVCNLFFFQTEIHF